MKIAARAKQRWDTVEYGRIEAVGYDAGRLTVRFADGSRVSLPTSAIAHPLLRDPDWSAVTADAFEIHVATPTGDFALPWDSIRALTDPEFGDHLDRVAATVTRQVGARVRALREERGLDLTDLAGRAGVSAETVTRIETGQEESSLEELERLLRPLGCTLDHLVEDG
jgi:DNA-binding XRE family transcriptional regulator